MSIPVHGSTELSQRKISVEHPIVSVTQLLLRLVKNKEYLERLQMVIRRLYGADSKWLETIPVLETHDGITVWEGDVELFQVKGHPRARRCYAWSNHDRKNEQLAAVLERPPVKNANDAVKFYLLKEFSHGN